MKDCVIIGAGPAGLAAAIYGMRAGLNLVVMEKLSPGGQVMTTYEVENYPGFVDPVEGWDLVGRMEGQARRLGAQIESGEILSIGRDSSKEMFLLTRDDGTVIETRTVIMATGVSLKKLDVPGEGRFLGRGVSYCGTCDGAFFRGKEIAVVGGGDTALEEAHFLTRFVQKVYLVHRRDKFRGTRILQDRVLCDDKIMPVYNSVVESINGTDKVTGATLKNVLTGEVSTIALDGVFIFIGHHPNTALAPAEVLNDAGEIITDIRMCTSVPGFFAAGDLREGSGRQIVMAASDGAIAAMSSYAYIESLNVTCL